MAGLARLADARRLATLPLSCSQRTSSIVHGTTTGDNTMIQMSGAPTGSARAPRVSATRSSCAVASRRTSGTRRYPAPAPIARRRVRLEVAERVDRGRRGRHARSTRTPSGARPDACATFGVTSIAIVFLHSYLNPDHELRARELVLEEYPRRRARLALARGVSRSRPSSSARRPRSSTRTSARRSSAYLTPARGAAARARLRPTSCSLATSAGGVATADAIGAARRRHDRLGPDRRRRRRGARRDATAGLGDVVSVDMGGTSYDVCLIRGGRPELKSDWNWRHRYCIALPMVDIHAIGAGGGSIASVVGGDAPRSGPSRPGSEPGPVVLRAGRHRADGDRRRPRARAARPRRRSGAGGCSSTSVGARRALERAWDASSASTPRSAAAAVVAHRRRAHDRCRPPCALARRRRPAPSRSRARSAGWARCTPPRRPPRSGCGACSSRAPRRASRRWGCVTADHVVDDARTHLARLARGRSRPAQRARRRPRAHARAPSSQRAGVPERAHRARVAPEPRLPGPDVRQRDPAGPHRRSAGHGAPTSRPASRSSTGATRKRA